MMTEAPEPKGKLDAATMVVVNGPEDVTLNWDAIDWRACEQNVRRLRQRIFTASQAGDLERVRNLQKLMLRSRRNTLVSVRRVTERNAGRKTAGIDGEVALTPEAKADLAERLQRSSERSEEHTSELQSLRHLVCRRALRSSPARRSSDLNAGRKTAGIDGEVALTPEAKADLAERLQRSSE